MTVLNEHVKSASPLSIQRKLNEQRANANRRGTTHLHLSFIIRCVSLHFYLWPCNLLQRNNTNTTLSASALHYLLFSSVCFNLHPEFLSCCCYSHRFAVCHLSRRVFRDNQRIIIEFSYIQSRCLYVHLISEIYLINLQWRVEYKWTIDEDSACCFRRYDTV